MHVVIFAGGTLRPGKAVQAAIASTDLVIAADSGAAAALQYGCKPSIIVGDFDSLDPLTAQQLQARGSRRFKSFNSGAYVFFSGARERRDRHGANFLRYLLDRFQVTA